MNYQTQYKLCLECSTYIPSDSHLNDVINYFCNSCAEKLICQRLFKQAYIRRFNRYIDDIQFNDPTKLE